MALTPVSPWPGLRGALGAADAQVAGLAGDGLEALLAACEPCVLPADEVLFERGDPPDALYIVVQGRLHVDDAHDDLRPRARVGRGSTVGHLGVLTGAPRRATVRAARDTVLLRLPIAAFRALALAQPAWLFELVARAVRQENEGAPM